MKENLFIDAVKDKDYIKKEDILIKKNKYCETSYYRLNKNTALKSKLREGDFYNIFFDYNTLLKSPNNIKKEVQRCLNILIKKYQKNNKLLIIGLGNSQIISDALGPYTTNKIMATYQYNFITIPKVALFNPEVIDKTGISSYKLIKMVTSYLKPDLIIVIDSCVTNNINNLNNNIEISDAGVIHGASINHNHLIDKNTFNVPVLSLIVPLIYKNNTYLLTSPNIKDIVNNYSKLISDVLKNICFGKII